MACRRFDGHVGYKGQKYEVRISRDQEESILGWQNSPDGGLLEMAKLMPGVTSARIVEIKPLESETRSPDADSEL